MTPGSLEKTTLDEEVFGPLKEKFVGLGILMEEMWDLIMPETSDMLHGFGGRPKTRVKLKKFLLKRPLGGIFAQSDRFWANDALNKALDAHNVQWHDGTPSVRWASSPWSRISGGSIADGGVISGSKMFGDTIPESITAPDQNSEPSDEELSKAVQDYLITQDMSTVTLRCVVLPLGRWRRDSLPSNRTTREAIGLRFPRADLSSKRSFLNESIGNHVWAHPAVSPPVISSTLPNTRKHPPSTTIPITTTRVTPSRSRLPSVFPRLQFSPLQWRHHQGRH